MIDSRGVYGVTLHQVTWMRINEIISRHIESDWAGAGATINMRWDRKIADERHPVAKIAAIMRHINWDWSTHRGDINRLSGGLSKIEYHVSGGRKETGAHWIHAAEHLTPEGLDKFVSEVDAYFVEMPAPQPWVEAILAEPAFDISDEDIFLLAQPVKPVSELMGTW